MSHGALRASAGVLVLVAGFAGAADSGTRAIAATADPPLVQTQIRKAYSRDGLHFEDAGAWQPGASSADLFRMPGGSLLALFESAGAGEDRPGGILYRRSSDDGKTWSKPLPIRVSGQPDGRGARDADLVTAPDGYLRLYYVVEDTHRRTEPDSRGRDVVRCGVTRDGVHYRDDERFSFPPRHGVLRRPSAVVINGTMHLFLEVAKPGTRRDGAEFTLLHTISSDGRHFARVPAPRFGEEARFGSVIESGGEARAYLGGRGGVISFKSRDGRRWERDQGTRLKEGWDPAVVRLTDGGFLMLYSTSLASEQGAEAGAELAVGAGADGDLPPGIDDGGGADGDEGQPLVDSDNSTGEDESGFQPSTAGSAEDIDASGEGVEQEAALESDTEAAIRELEDWWEEAALLGSQGFAPAPDFVNPVDYLQWYRDFVGTTAGENANDRYAEMAPRRLRPDGEGQDWPEVRNLFLEESYDGLPEPWDPAEHPEWEASNAAMKDLLGEFRSAAEVDEYASPAEASGLIPEGDKLLLGIMLPSLQPHRDLVRATLADAWRLEDGRVSKERMHQAIRTSIQAASHLTGGFTLIEQLVGMAEKNFVYETARAALREGVFESAEDIERTLEILRSFDRAPIDAAVSIRGEHAMAMDLTQYLFTPATAEGLAQLNPARAEALSDVAWDDDMIDRFKRMTPADAYRTIATVDRHYRELGELMRIGYPAVRGEDISALERESVKASPLTRDLLPALSRIHQLRARREAARRATQLTYATHLFRARHGRWPESLDELPVDHGVEMRIDPYTGEYFGYRLGDDGPRIYSRSENGIDDGGAHSPQWGDGAKDETETDDHVFWPPQPR